MATYNISGGMSLHDARAILLGTNHKIMHTGKVNSYARCQGSKLKKAISVPDAREIIIRFTKDLITSVYRFRVCINQFSKCLYIFI